MKPHENYFIFWTLRFLLVLFYQYRPGVLELPTCGQLPGMHQQHLIPRLTVAETAASLEGQVYSTVFPTTKFVMQTHT